jgi:hypothetical protein
MKSFRRSKPPTRLSGGIILRNARALQADVELLADLEQQALRACLREQSAEQIVLDAGVFEGLSAGLQRRVLMQAVLRLRPGLRDVGLEALERALVCCKRASALRFSWQPGSLETSKVCLR